MKVTINGQIKDISNAANIADIVGQFCANKKHIITEVNGTLVPRDDWNKTSLKEGDAIELVSFVGGG